MALNKTITLPSEQTGKHIRVCYYHCDYISKEASAHFYLYTSATAKRPICLIAKLRLSGAKFDQYLSTEALRKMENPGPDACRSALYCAAKAGEPIIAGGELTAVDLSDAEDV